MNIYFVTMEYLKKFGKCEEAKKRFHLEEGVLEKIFQMTDEGSDKTTGFGAGVQAFIREQIVEQYGCDAGLHYLANQMETDERDGKGVKI